VGGSPGGSTDEGTRPPQPAAWAGCADTAFGRRRPLCPCGLGARSLPGACGSGAVEGECGHHRRGAGCRSGRSPD
jgi:hypothetical protein